MRELGPDTASMVFRSYDNNLFYTVAGRRGENKVPNDVRPGNTNQEGRHLSPGQHTQLARVRSLTHCDLPMARGAAFFFRNLKRLMTLLHLSSAA
jgi:hypothetical protein